MIYSKNSSCLFIWMGLTWFRFLQYTEYTSLLSVSPEDPLMFASQFVSDQLERRIQASAVWCYRKFDGYPEEKFTKPPHVIGPASPKAVCSVHSNTCVKECFSRTNLSHWIIVTVLLPCLGQWMGWEPSP